MVNGAILQTLIKVESIKFAFNFSAGFNVPIKCFSTVHDALLGSAIEKAYIF